MDNSACKMNPGSYYTRTGGPNYTTTTPRQKMSTRWLSTEKLTGAAVRVRCQGGQVVVMQLDDAIFDQVW